ncbi:hypothetical protein [Neorhodopirellula pilleata]|uniref:hypothetical protein n=1 Tax=Neorhodopirellula pilleata TaxID=2714738 RepID=UPI0011B682C8|nr:hypothetical protein [Neorhodopirellula pilleata]
MLESNEIDPAVIGTSSGQRINPDLGLAIVGGWRGWLGIRGSRNRGSWTRGSWTRKSSEDYPADSEVLRLRLLCHTDSEVLRLRLRIIGSYVMM